MPTNLAASLASFALVVQWPGLLPSTPRRHPLPAASAADAKATLFDAIAKFDAARARDGTVAIDFGVKGGELDKDSRAPSNLAESGAFYAVSKEVGEAADSVMEAVDALAPLNPTQDATALFGTAEGANCPLHGSWTNVFTTAADATFSPNSTRGDANVFNTVDAVRGRLWNVIDFKGSPGKPPVLEQFRVRLSAKAVSPMRIELIFRFVNARLSQLKVPLLLALAPVLPLLLGLEAPRLAKALLCVASLAVSVPVPLLGRRVTLTLPVPGPALTSVLFAFRKKKPPQAYFEVIYLDNELRVHRTGQGNLFVQTRPPWGKGV